MEPDERVAYEYWSVVVRGEGATYLPHLGPLTHRHAAPYLHEVVNGVADAGREFVRSDLIRYVRLRLGGDEYLVWFRRVKSKMQR